MSDSSYFHCFWADIKEKLRLMHQLDPELNLLYGAQCHKYGTQPTVSDRDLLAFEKKNGIVLPASYRTYLQFFGDCGASQFNGTLSFMENISRIDVSKPSAFPELGVYHDYSEGEYPQNTDGQVEITRGFNPSSAYLVLNGRTTGQVYWSDCWSMAGSLGKFDDWYTNWSTNVLGRLRLQKRVEEFPLGTHLSELQDAFPDLVRTFQYGEVGPTHARVGASTNLFELDSSDNVVAVRLRKCGNISDDSCITRIDY